MTGDAEGGEADPIAVLGFDDRRRGGASSGSRVSLRAGAIQAPDAWLVGSNGVLTLAEIISVVELHRLDVKRQRRSDD